MMVERLSLVLMSVDKYVVVVTECVVLLVWQQQVLYGFFWHAGVVRQWW